MFFCGGLQVCDEKWVKMLNIETNSEIIKK